MRLQNNHALDPGRPSSQARGRFCDVSSELRIVRVGHVFNAFTGLDLRGSGSPPDRGGTDGSSSGSAAGPLVFPGAIATSSRPWESGPPQ